eukprot:scaffold30955_cov49-Phaeocystis_antarctica.AAC.2
MYPNAHPRALTLSLTHGSNAEPPAFAHEHSTYATALQTGLPGLLLTRRRLAFDRCSRRTITSTTPAATTG